MIFKYITNFFFKQVRIMKKSLLSMSMLHFSLAVFLCFSLSFCGGMTTNPHRLVK